MSSEPGPNQQCVAVAGRAEPWRLGYMLSFLRHNSLPGRAGRPWDLQRGDMFYFVMLVDWLGGWVDCVGVLRGTLHPFLGSLRCLVYISGV
jgi:hypothetical protein